jgi:predicted secreted protein
MATGTLNGSDLVLKISKTPLGYRDVAYATSFTLDIETDAVDRTHKDSGGWKEIFLGVKSWSITCDALYQNEANPLFNYYIDAFASVDNRTKVQVEFSVNNAQAGDNNVRYRGSAFVVSLNLKGETETGAEFQIFLAGDRFLNETEY